MARRIKSKKRKYLGNRTFGGGNTKNRRGKGNRGGVSRAGFHKHKWLHTIKFEGTRQKDRGIKGFFNPTRRNLKEISLRELSGKIAAGEFKPDSQGVYSITLEGFKVLSSGSVGVKLAVRATGFSKKAVEKIMAAGGTVNTD